MVRQPPAIPAQRSVNQSKDGLDACLVRGIRAEGLSVSGFDFAQRLRRGLGKGKVLPPEIIAQKLVPFDGNKDGAVTAPELSEFFKANGIGPFVSSFLAKTIFNLCSTAVGQSVTWIKLEPLSKLISDAMGQAPPRSKRYVLTPEGMQGYEPLESVEEFEARQARGAPRPRSGGNAAARGRPPTQAPRSGPAPRGRPSPRPGPRRPGPGSGPKR